MTTDSQKPTRQPQARKASSDRVTERTSSTTVASRLPSGPHDCGNLPQKARLLFGLCPVTSSTAPPHSPPCAKPRTKHSNTSSAGAHSNRTGVRQGKSVHDRVGLGDRRALEK